jgi:BirA family biotin operon repressor/biotin-[acetyl-CoA-carboxylase] ligase
MEHFGAFAGDTLMDSGIFLWGTGNGQHAGCLSPVTLADSHFLWAEDVGTLGPWSKVETSLFGSKKSHLLWKASQKVSDKMVLVCGPCPTSMDVAWAFDKFSALPDWGSVMTVEQTAGRGRWHRQWMSPPGNLYATWVWPKELNRYGAVLDIPELLSLVVAYVLVSALKAQKIDAQIKWPNDLFINGHKIGGVLIEKKHARTMVGIGLNLVSAPPNEALRREGVPAAGFLAQVGLVLKPLSGWLELSRLAKKCLEEQVRHLSPGEFIGLVEEHFIGIGRRVVVQTEQEEPFAATIEGLAPDGSLILKRNRTEFLLYSGSILFEEGLNSG